MIALALKYGLYAVAGMAGAWLAWQVQGFRLDAVKSDYAQYQVMVGQQAAEARKAALNQRDQWAKEKEHAINDARAREVKLRADLGRAQSAAGGLRNDLAALRNRLPDAPAETGHRVVGALGDVLGECSERYNALAGVADQCTSDLKTLSDSWPK